MTAPGFASLPAYPVREFLPEILRALGEEPRLAVVAAPGSGKTTLVPLALLQAPWRRGKILVQEPRRVAAKAAAQRLSLLLGTNPGTAVGWRVRGETKACAETEIEVVTDGVLLRMLQEDPALEGVAAVVFDEFHERSTNADLALLFARDAQENLRPDLRLLALSATPDLAALRRVFGEHRTIDVPGTLHPVAVVHREPSPSVPLEEEIAKSLLARLEDPASGSVLVFLPGFAEISRVRERIEDRLPEDVELFAMHRSLPLAEQTRAIEPAPPGRRKVILSSSIAESSVTIEGIRVVLDAGLERVSAFDEARGLSRLATRRESADSAAQRAGRAGRTCEGVCVRFWPERETLRPNREPEILRCDMSRVVLECALWGASDPGALPWPTPPDPGKWERARAALERIGALAPDGKLTPLGKRIAALPLAPATGAFLLRAADLGAGNAACRLAALMEEDLPASYKGCDVSPLLRPGNDVRVAGGGTLSELAARLAETLRLGKDSARLSPGLLALLARPDALARRRPGQSGKLSTSGGQGLYLPEGDALRTSEWLVALQAGGAGADLRIRAAVPFDPEELRAAPEELRSRWIREERALSWNAQKGAASVKVSAWWGALLLSETPGRAAEEEELSAWRKHLLSAGGAALPWSEGARTLVARVRAARAAAPGLWPDWSDENLVRLAAEAGRPLREGDLVPWLRGELGFPQCRKLDADVPDRFVFPNGRSQAIDWSGERPVLAAPLQDFFGVSRHPTAGGAPLRVVLLSPARRPIQTTEDLPGFWRGSYAEVRKEMKGRYPKHNWPEDPWNAQEARKRKPPASA